MHVAIQRSESDLTIRIPGYLATQAGLQDGMQVEIQVVNGTLTIAPVSKHYDLEQLLDSITSNNLHDEVDTGKAIGSEAW